MTNTLRQLLFIAAALSLSTASIAADAGPRTVSTTGQGVATASADRAVVSMQASATNKSANAAKQAADQQINAALSSLEDMGIAKEDIVASTIHLMPEYQYANQQRTFTGYQAVRDLTVTLQQLDELDSLLETLTQAGINNITSVTLQSSNEDELREEAFTLAIEDSKQKAAKLAKAYGAELGNIRAINYRNMVPMARAKGDAMMLQAASAGGGQYVHDQVRIEDQIDVEFELIIAN